MPGCPARVWGRNSYGPYVRASFALIWCSLVYMIPHILYVEWLSARHWCVDPFKSNQGCKSGLRTRSTGLFPEIWVGLLSRLPFFSVVFKASQKDNRHFAGSKSRCNQAKPCQQDQPAGPGSHLENPLVRWKNLLVYLVGLDEGAARCEAGMRL